MSNHLTLPPQLAAAAAKLEAEAEEPHRNSQSASPCQILLPKRRLSRSTRSTVPATRAVSSGSEPHCDNGPLSSASNQRLVADDQNWAYIANTTPLNSPKRLSTRLNWREQPSQTSLNLNGLPSAAAANPANTGDPLTGPVNKQTAVPVRSRSSSLASQYDTSKLVNVKHTRQGWVRLLVQYGIYTVFLCFVYFVLIGLPLWNGAVYWLYVLVKNKFVFQGGWSIVVILVILFSFTPLLLLFEDSPPGPEFYQRRKIKPAPAESAATCALIIPAYRSASIIGRTLNNALQIFPPSHIFVVANGNSSTPLDNTGDLCRARGVNHIWCPIGSKIIAIFVGCHAASGFRHVLLMDDDCLLPAGFPVVTSRLRGRTQCISYTIGCTDPPSSPSSSDPAMHPTATPTWCQRAQDFEYKLAGLQRYFAGRVGSASFPHGAISLWDKRFLKRVLEHHPGFSISEDWFLGHVCRQLGGRIQMSSAVFVHTETPAVMFFARRLWWKWGEGNSARKSRGGFGEITVFKQRFSRWNFFVASCLWHNVGYLVGSWKLGWMEVGTKLFVAQEVYETLTYLLLPFILPISLLVKPVFCITMLLAITGLYLLQAILFNEIHLRRKNQQVSYKIVMGYYVPYKFALHLINVAGCFWCMFQYAQYFAQQRLKLTEDHKVVGMVLKLEEQMRQARGQESAVKQELGRRLTVTKFRVMDRGSSP